jgi:mRNA interferase HigB
VHVISRKRLREFWAVHAEAEAPLAEWFKVASKAVWRKFAEVRATYASADVVGKFVVFNVGGNKYRLITQIYYEERTLLIRHVLTHAEYDRAKWKA